MVRNEAGPTNEGFYLFGDGFFAHYLKAGVVQSDCI